MNIRQRLNAPFNGSFKTIRRIGARKIHGGLDGGEDILSSMLCFPSEGDDVLVVLSSHRDVSGDF